MRCDCAPTGSGRRTSSRGSWTSGTYGRRARAEGMKHQGRSGSADSTAIGGPLFQMARQVSRALLAVLARPRLVGAAHVPPHGSLLVVSNHASMIDTIVLAA